MTKQHQSTKTNNDIELPLQMKVLMDSLSDGIYIANGKGYPLYFNNAYEKMIGLGKQEINERHVKDLVKEGYIEESVVLQVIEKKKPISRLIRYRTGIEALISGNPVFSETGEVVSVVCNLRDITELRRLEEELNATRAESALYRQQLTEIQAASPMFKEVVVSSDSLKKIIQTAVKLAHVDSTVLVQGESGVGKEAIVRMIHEESVRKDTSFIKVNCSAIPESLMEAELFGYEKGAFTGAINKGKAGLVELAGKGTLFLDEIGELPYHLQAKLLHALQEREVYRIGGTQSYNVEARIIAATNRDLKEMIDEKQFREDLFYRLNVVPLYIPPLRERRADIIPLVRHFTEVFNQRHGKNKRLAHEVFQVFERYDWPGNVRELQNTLERMVVLSDSDVITVDLLPDSLSFSDEKKGRHVWVRGIVPLKEARNELEKVLITKALEQNKTLRKAGEVLEISHSSIISKMKQWRCKR